MKQSLTLLYTPGLFYKSNFTLSIGAHAVFATAAEVPPSAKSNKKLDYFFYGAGVVIVYS